jgi:hypothetical protein
MDSNPFSPILNISQKPWFSRGSKHFFWDHRMGEQRFQVCLLTDFFRSQLSTISKLKITYNRVVSKTLAMFGRQMGITIISPLKSPHLGEIPSYLRCVLAAFAARLGDVQQLSGLL